MRMSTGFEKQDENRLRIVPDGIQNPAAAPGPAADRPRSGGSAFRDSGPPGGGANVRRRQEKRRRESRRPWKRTKTSFSLWKRRESMSAPCSGRREEGRRIAAGNLKGAAL